MLLPPSIIERKILLSKPDDYGCYMYNFIDTKHTLKAPYLGIKKDKLPEDGGTVYWSSSQNEKFLKLIQGNEPRFILEIIDFRKRSDYDYLQLKEYKMLKEYSNIKTNPAIYNLSYGIPPSGSNGLLTKEFTKWFKETRKSGIWDTIEKVKSIIKNNALQIRDEDNPSFVKDISAELQAIGGNPKNMNTVLIFEGVGGLFGFEEGSDIIAGTTHGLKSAKKAKVIEMGVTRVPYDILKDKSAYFIRALAGNDNYDDQPLSYKANYKDGAKLLTKLYDEKNISPESDIAKDQLIITYNLKTRAISDAIKKSLTDIEMNKKGDTKWKIWTQSELLEKVTNAKNEKLLAISMSSGMYKWHTITETLANDNWDVKGGKRKKIKVFIYHPWHDYKELWDEQNSAHKKFLKNLLLPHGWRVEFKELDHEVVDTNESI